MSTGILPCLLALTAGWLIGSLSPAILFSRLCPGGDIRARGSGNAGATNMARVYGMGAGLMTLGADMLKTAAAILAGRLLAGETGLVLAGAGCLIGHCWPVFHCFRGGKGVAVGAGLALCLDWRLFLLLLGVFALAFLLSRRVSVCSLSCALAFPLGQLLLGHSALRLGLGVLVCLLVWYAHRENLRRLLRGEEPPFTPGHRDK